MKRLTGALALLMSLALQACLSSSLVVRVAPDGHATAVITSRLYEQPYRAFEQIFQIAGGGAEQTPIDQALAASTEETLSTVLGTAVNIDSTTLEKTADGVVRKTTFSIRDITQARLLFPPVLESPGHGGWAVGNASEPPMITFAMRPHENGDRMLVVRMPETRMFSEGNAQATPQPGTPQLEQQQQQEQEQIKRATRGMRLEFAVELDVPLLRTNAPARDGNRAIILDVDVGKIINELDDRKMSRLMMTTGSVQELLWAIGDVGGGVTPDDGEIFLEFEAPAAQPPAQPPAQAPRPDTDVFLAPLTLADGRIDVGAAINITSNPGYDNQPFFTPDGRAVLFTSVRGENTQTDVYRYDIASSTLTQVTRTPESEYSPTITPSGDLSVVRVELDKESTQRLWRFTADGRDPRVVLDAIKPVGYHAWADDHTVVVYVLGRPATLQAVDTRTGTARIVATDVARSLQPIPGGHTISFVQRERAGGADTLLTIKELNASTGEVKTLTRAMPGGDEADVAWTPDGTLLIARDDGLYAWRRGAADWRRVAALDRLGLRRVTRLAVSPAGDRIAFVAQP